MARVFPSTEPVDDVGTFPRQRAKALYARRFAEAHVWLYANRGRVLAEGSFTRERHAPLFASPTTVGNHHFHRTETGRQMVLAVTTLWTSGLSRDTPIAGSLTFDTHAGGSADVVDLDAQIPARPFTWLGGSTRSLAEFARRPTTPGRGRLEYAPRINLWAVETSIANVELQMTIALSGECLLRHYALFEAPLVEVSA